MKKITLIHQFITCLLIGFLCLARTGKTWALDYNCVVTSVSVSQSDEIMKNKFTLTIYQDAIATASGNTTFPNHIDLVLESNDRTLEGTYSSSSTATNQINKDETDFVNGSTHREIKTGSIFEFVISKVSDGVYKIKTCTLCLQNTSSHSGTYNYRYAYANKTNAIAGTTTDYQFNFTPKYANAPTGVTASAITGSTATVSWTSSESAWKYVCLPTATTLTEDHWTSAVSTNAKSANLTGLTPASSYTFYVISDRGANGTSVIAFTEFTTGCDVISTIPWTEGFESATSGQTPTCWGQVLSNANGWFRAISGSSYKHSGSKAARLYGGKNGNSVVTAVFPEFEDDIKTLALSFWYKTGVSDGDYTYGQPQLGYITNPNDASTFVTIGDALDQSSSYVQVENFTVPSNTPNGAYFAIRYAGGLDNEYVCIDDITVTEKPACNKPTGVSASSVTDEDATITWNVNGMSAWKLQVSEGDAASWGSDISVATNSKVLTGLNANTLYYVRVKADCGGAGDSEWSDNVSFTTLCGTVNVSAASAWNNDFEGLSDHIIPDCWDNTASTTTSSWGAGYIWGTYSRFSNTMLSMDNSVCNGGTALINTPSIAIPNDGKEYELTFDHSNMAAAGNNLLVKISANGGAFTEKGTYYPSGNVSSYPGTFTTATINLADYSGKTIKIQFFANPTSGTSSDGGAMFIDNISVHKVATCFPPTALAAGNLTANSARITWTAGASETAWRLQYRAEGGSWSAEQSVSTNARHDLSGLSANTEYFVRVKAYCDAEDQSEWSEIASFTTLCAAASIPFEENFSNASELPSCWQATPVSGTYRWAAHENSGAYDIQLRTGSSGEAELRMPAISLSEAAILRFEWKNANGAQVNIYISTDGGSSRTMLPNDLSGVHSDWTTKVFDLSAFTGETVLIYFVSNFTTVNQYAYLDDVEVIARPCEMILNITAAPVTGGATISWSGNVKKLQYKLATADSWTSETIAAANYAGPKSISSLIPARTYQVRLLPECVAEAEANWTAPISFTTTTMESVPYSNNFETETPGEVPFNWSRVSASEYPQVSHDAYAYKEGESFGYQGNSIKFYGVNDQIIVLPEFDANLGDLMISFHYRNRDCVMELGYVESDGTTFVALETLPNQTGYGEFPFEKDLFGISSDAANLAIRYSNAVGATAQCWVDNVEVKEATCGQPTDLAFDNLTATSVHITWSASERGGESNYQYIRQLWSEEDPNWASATLIGSDVTELNLTGLTPNREYEFYLRSYCGASDQSTPVKITFTTLMKDEVFEDVSSATNNETRLAALNGQTINMTIQRPLLLNGDYCTLCLPFDLSAAQIADPECPLHGFVIKEFEKSREASGEVNIYLNQVSSIEAGKAYFVRYAGAPSEVPLTPLNFRGVKIKVSTPIDEVLSDECTPHGVFNPYPLVANDHSTLFLSAANTLYYPSANGTMNGFRAYIKVGSGSSLSAPIRRGAPIRIVEQENTATGVGEIQGNDVQCTKVLRDGQLFIMYNGTMYDVQGRRIQ